MKLQTVGLAVTLVAVLVLLGSLVLGMRQPDASGLPGAVSLGEIREPPAERIRVEVLNSAGISGLARRVTERLRDAGFDVVYYGNASGSLARDSTTILDRGGNQAAVEALAEELGVERIETAVDTSLYLEATVVLGGDLELE